MVRYGIKVQHYGERPQLMHASFPKKWQAVRYIRQQLEIARKDGKQAGEIEILGAFIVFGEGGIHQTKFWPVRLESEKMKFTATFSTGQTVTRSSNNQYITAAAWVNRETGEVKNVTFSTTATPRPSRDGIFAVDNRRAYGSGKAYRRAMQRNVEEEKLWKVEIVEVEVDYAF